MARQVLLVQGRIVSTAKRVVDVPRLRFAIRDGSGNEIYTWTALPSRSLLAPGETLGLPVAAGLAAARDPRRAGAVLQPP